MKKNIYKIVISKIAIFLYLLLIVSCTEDFIDVEANEETESALTADKAPELVNSIYNQFLQWETSSFSWIGISSITSDDAEKGSVASDTGTDKHLLDGLNINATLLSVSEIWNSHYKGIQRANQALNRLPLFKKIDDKLKNRLIGEAKFLRGLYYFRLVKTYGGVPLIKGINGIADVTPKLLARATKKDTYAFIEKDLKEAITLLPKKSEYDDANLGRATKGAAKALLAKVSMYQGKWATVKTLTDEIIASKEYSLTPNYEDIWKEAGENNQESIFEIQATGKDPAAGVKGYSQVQGARGDGGFGWGFNTPTKDLSDSYESGDTRRDATIMFRGETLFDGRKINDNAVNPMYNQKAYSSEFSDSQQTGKNIRILRYAEVLLMNAEAATQVGGDALIPLNLVRKRAGLAAVKTATQATVWKERRWELAFEHDRYFDLVRQGRAGKILRAHGKPFQDGKHEVFPIPQEQIDKSPGVLIQNPGY